jgi:hypothetical protein
MRAVDRRLLLVAVVALWCAVGVGRVSSCRVRAQERPAARVVLHPQNMCELEGCNWFVELCYGCTCSAPKNEYQPNPRGETGDARYAPLWTQAPSLTWGQR